MIKKIFSLLTTVAISAAAMAQSNGRVAPATREELVASRDSQLVQAGFNALPKKYMSGSVSSIPGSVLKGLLVPNLKSALQGQAAGVHVVQSNGMPGSEAVVRVRGTSSIYAETEPLYIIDGFPVYSGPREVSDQAFSGWGSQFNPMSDFNMDDIESIEVLKDAAATAIYGARGGNGVILVTTKKGKRGLDDVEVKYNQGVTNFTNRVNSLNGTQYLQLLDEAWVNSGQTGQGPLPAINGFTRAMASATNNNDLDRTLDMGAVRQANISSSYASDKTNFYVSGSYRKEAGIVDRNDLTRYSARMKVSNQILPKLNLGVNLAMNYIDQENMPSGYSYGGGFNAAQLNLPVIPYYNPNGTYFFALNPGSINLPGTSVAAFQTKAEFENSEHTRRFYMDASFGYKLAKNLELNTVVGFEKYYHTRTDYLSKKVRNGSIGSGTGREGFPTAYAGYEEYMNNQYNGRSVLNYKYTKGDHRLVALAGFEYTYGENPFFFAEGEGFPNDFTKQPAIANYRNVGTALSLVANTTAFIGYLANANYAYKDKYLVGATFRYDGSSRFGANNKYAGFPAASLGWVVSREDFMKESVFNELKVRLSYGRTGNAGIGNYSSLERWSINANSRYLLQPGVQMVGLGSPDLKPEKRDQLDLGVDFALSKGRFSGTIDLYSIKTNDMLLSFNAPLSAGVIQPALLLNAGTLRNRGVELTVSSKNLVSGNLKWNTDLSLSRNSNEMLDLGGLTSQQLSYNKNIITAQGMPVGTFYLATYAGVDPATGREMIYDQAGNKVVATSAAQIDAARVAQEDKPSAPKLFGGLNNTFTYKRFDLGAFMTFSLGNYVLDEGERALSYLGGNNNLREDAMDRWTSSNTGASFPKLAYNDPIAGSNTTRFLHDASYLRIKNISLGYSLKGDGKLKFLKNARLYVTGQNVFTITKFKGWDPEVSGNYRAALDRSLSQGITYMEVPQVRTFVAGLNLNF